MDTQRSKNPTRNKRRQILVKITRELALEEFNKRHDPKPLTWTWTYYPGARTEKDKFESAFSYKIYEDEFNLQYGEIELMYPLYKKCLKTLEDKKKKADFVRKVYVPLEEDLFQII